MIISSFSVNESPGKKPLIAWFLKDTAKLAFISIRRSYDAVDFYEVARFSGSTNGTKSFIDYTAGANPYIYYMLVSADERGIETETAIKTFNNKEPEKIIISLTPNPLTLPHLLIKFYSVKEDILKLFLQDEQGNIIKTENITAEAGVNNAHLHVEDGLMKSGIYYLVCKLGNKIETHTLIR